MRCSSTRTTSPEPDVRCSVAVDALPADFRRGDVLVLSGDCPLADADTLSAFWRSTAPRALRPRLMTALVDDRPATDAVVRDADGRRRSHRGAEGRQTPKRPPSARSTPDVRVPCRDASGLPAQGRRRQRSGRDVPDRRPRPAAPRRRTGWRHRSSPTSRSPSASTTVLSWRGRSSAQPAHRAPLQLEGVTCDRPEPPPGSMTTRRSRPTSRSSRTRRSCGPRRSTSGAVIGPDTTLVDCEVGEDAIVRRTDATLAVIGAEATVGPFSFLRPGTVLGAKGKIGAYVETKNAEIERRQQGAPPLVRGRRHVRARREPRREHDHRKLPTT